MKFMKIVLVSLMIFSSSASYAALISSTGYISNFDYDIYSFQLGAPSTVGISVVSDTDPVLYLFSNFPSEANLIGFDDDSGSGPYDSYMSRDLSSGIYSAVVAPYPYGLIEGTCDIGLVPCDYLLTGPWTIPALFPMNYTLTIVADSSLDFVPVPEPAILPLLGLSLIGLAFARRNRNINTVKQSPLL